VAAAKAKAAELARKKAAAEAAARENARRVAEAKAAEEKAKAAARAAAMKDAQQKARADQLAKEAESNRRAAELKAEVDKKRHDKEVAEAKKDNEEVATMSSVDRMMSGGFEANRGRLPMPITGGYRVVSHYGQYNVEGLSGVTLDNKGINIKGNPGCSARSIYDGEVSAVFGFGGSMVVMVRHGAYISVYCNLKSVFVHRGQRVSTRQALGAVANDNILQFQLRRETGEVEP
jgi:septal ring factor EnvC (AmiA/AmiB activator)